MPAATTPSRTSSRAAPPVTATRNLFVRVPTLLWLLLLTSVCLLPFLGKPFHVDDTLFLRIAAHIQKHPVDFFGFKMNWYGNVRPMVENFDNPPLTCYYIALVTGVLGWGEVPLHLAFMVPALFAIAGIFTLARLYTRHNAFAAIVALFTPVFLISSTTIMCDVMLLAFWSWAIVFFEKGLREKNITFWLVSGLLGGLAFLTKFIGIALIPLLGAYGLVRQRRLGLWLIAPLLPVLFVSGYELLTYRLYGKGLLLTAFHVAGHALPSIRSTPAEKFVVGLSFLGGCFLPLLLLIPWLWSPRSLLRGLCIVAPVLLFYPYLGKFALLWDSAGRVNWLFCIQSAVFIAGGVHVLVLALTDLWLRRDAASLLLFLWVGGIFVFAAKINWTINGRSLLPMLPAVAILGARRLESRTGVPLAASLKTVALPISVAAVLAFVAVVADYNLARSARVAAKDVCQKFTRAERTLWFQGHWGFQYYVEQYGAKPLDSDLLELRAKDIVVVPSEGVNTFDMSTNLVRLIDTLEYTPNNFCSTISLSAGSGFYAGAIGPFPFSFGFIQPERYYIFEATHSRDEVNWKLSPFESGALGQLFDLERIRTHERERLGERGGTKN